MLSDPAPERGDDRPRRGLGPGISKTHQVAAVGGHRGGTGHLKTNPVRVEGWAGCEPLEEVWGAPFPQDWAARKSQRKKESGEGERGKGGEFGTGLSDEEDTCFCCSVLVVANKITCRIPFSSQNSWTLSHKWGSFLRLHFVLAKFAASVADRLPTSSSIRLGCRDLTMPQNPP